MDCLSYKFTCEAEFKSKFKTEICRNWTQRLCEFGEKCTFAHGIHELRGKEPKTGNYRTKKCKQFHEQGFCQYGGRCQFKHKALYLDTASSSPREAILDSKRRLPVFVRLTEANI